MIGLETDRNESLTLVYSLPNLEDGRCFFSIILFRFCCWCCVSTTRTTNETDRRENVQGKNHQNQSGFAIFWNKRKRIKIAKTTNGFRGRGYRNTEQWNHLNLLSLQTKPKKWEEEKQDIGKWWGHVDTKWIKLRTQLYTKAVNRSRAG